LDYGGQCESAVYLGFISPESMGTKAVGIQLVSILQGANSYQFSFTRALALG